MGLGECLNVLTADRREPTGECPGELGILFNQKAKLSK